MVQTTMIMIGTLAAQGTPWIFRIELLLRFRFNQYVAAPASTKMMPARTRTSDRSS